jgi:hypothetical protein
MGAGPEPLQVKKHRADHDRDEEHHAAVLYLTRLKTAGVCGIFPDAVE